MVKTKCLYCDNMTAEPHFESQCCGRGMCDECYDALQGTDEQLQVLYVSTADYEDIKKKYEDADFLCFDCEATWRKKPKRHDNEICAKYNEPVLPDEDGNGSLCGAEIYDKIKKEEKRDNE